MKFAPFLLSFFALASSAYANGPSITVGAGQSSFSSKASVEGENFTDKTKLQTGYLGVFLPSSENFGIGLELGAGVHTGKTNYSTRSVKLAPNYKVLDHGIWVFAGAAHYDIRETGVNHGVTTGLVGAAFRPEAGAEGLNLDFSVSYEKSLAAEDFSAGEASVSSYKLENLATTFGFAYSL